MVCCAQSLTATPSASAQAAGQPQPSNNPINLLWSALGSSPIAGLLYSLLRGEQTERRATVAKMVASFEAEAENKAQLRERMKAQDEALARIADLVKSVDQRLAQLFVPGGGRPAA